MTIPAPPKRRKKETTRQRHRWRGWNKRPVVAGLACVAVIAASVAIGYYVGIRRGTPPASEAEAPPEEKSKPAAGVSTWTCAMHPQIKLPKPGKCPICFMPLIPLADNAADEGSPRQLEMSERAVALAEIQTAPVRRQYATNEVQMVGKVDYDETRLADITAWVAGRLDDLRVDYTGTRVRKGDPMASIYSEDLVVAQRELLQTWERLEPLGRESDRRLVEERLRLVEDKLRLLGLPQQEIEAIKKRGTASDHVTIFAPAGGTVIQRHVSEGSRVQIGAKIYTIADLSQVWVFLDAYESDLPWILNGQQVEFSTETYPGEIFKGRVAFIDPMLDDQTRTARVRVNVPNADRRLKPGMFVRAVVRSRLAAGGKVFDPSLIGKWISPMHPEIVKDGPGKCDLCGMDLVPAESLGYDVPRKAPEMPLLIPATAPLITGRRAVVYVRLPDKERPTFEGREVLLGERAGDSYVVRHGLEEGELVVTQGNFKIDSSLQIQARPSMMSPEGGAIGTGHQHGGSDVAAAGSGRDGSRHGKTGIVVPSAFRVLLNPLYDAYLEAADALAADDLAAARAALEKIPPAVTGVDSSALDEAGRKHWEQASDRVIFAAYEAREATKRDDARRHFGELSRAVTGLIETFGHALPGPVHRVHCPMALDAKGADWLQRSQQVRNPYYGRAMLGCGDRVATYESQAPLDVPDEFRRQLGGVYEAYLQLQTALAGDREEQAKAAFGQLRAAVAAPDAGLLEGRTLHAWQAARTELTRAFEGNWEAADMDEIRKRFEPVSDTVLAVVEDFGHAAAVTFYRAFCPMAFNNQGAAWLQAGEQIANPYFGQKMLGCGEIQRTFPPAVAAAGQHHEKEGPHDHQE